MSIKSLEIEQLLSLEKLILISLYFKLIDKINTEDFLKYYIVIIDSKIITLTFTMKMKFTLK